MEKHKSLVKLLIKNSDRPDFGKPLEWSPGVEENSFQVSFKDNSVRIALGNNARGRALYRVELINSEGVVVDAFDDEDLDVAAPQEYEWFKNLRELYDMARRRALGADEVLNQILGELGDIPF